MSEFAVRRPVTVLMLCLGLTVLGLISISKIKMRLLPPLTSPEFSIITKYKGASPSEVEGKITTPIEESVSTQAGLYDVQSVSEVGQSTVFLKFSSNISIRQTISEIREKLNDLDWPEGVTRPRIVRFNPSSLPIFQAAITPNSKSKMSDLELASYIRDTLVVKLESQDGVAVVNLFGTSSEEIIVTPDPIKCAALGVDITSLPEMILEQNKSVNAGTIRHNKRSVSIRFIKKLRSVSDIENIVLKAEKGKLRLMDVAEVTKVLRKSAVRTHLNGNSSLVLEVKKEAEANTVEVIAGIKKVFANFMSNNMDLDQAVLINQGDEIKSSIDNVVSTVISGGILASIIIYLFLQNMGPTFIVTLSIPMSIMITMILMYFTGVSFNLMSLGGLALGVGMLVDNAIVVLENISKMKMQMKDKTQAVIWGTKTVSSAIVASTLTTVAVFAPLIFVEGMIGQLFKDISLTVVYSLTSSLFVALLLIPTLSSITDPDDVIEEEGFLSAFFLPDDLVASCLKKYNSSLLWYPLYSILFSLKVMKWCLTAGVSFLMQGVVWLLKSLINLVVLMIEWSSLPIINSVNQTLDKMKTYYQRFLNRYLEKYTLPLTLVFGTFFATLIGFYYKGAELFPSDQVSKLNYQMEFRAGVTVTSNEREISRLEQKLMKLKGVKTITSIIGRGGSHRSSLMCLLHDGLTPLEIKHTDKSIQYLLSQIPGLKSSRIVESMISSSKPIVIEIFADEFKVLRKMYQKAFTSLETLKSLQGLEGSLKGDFTEVLITFDPDKLRQYGLDHSMYQSQLALLIMGKNSSQLKIKNNILPIAVNGTSFMNSLQAVKNFSIVGESEIPIPLSQVAKIELSTYMAQINHSNGRRVAVLTADLHNTSLDKASTDIKNILATALPKDAKWQMGGQDQERQKSQQSMLFALILSIFLIYLLLASQFENLVQPLIILIAVPLCIIGVYLILGLTGTAVSALVLVGFVILAGISVNTSIVLVDSINQNIREGMEFQLAVTSAACNRLRPILMTALTTIIGLIPMAISFGSGAAMRAPLAITVIGGLISSTILTLLAVPLIYSLFTRKKDYAK